ncbi:putative TRAFAC class dynamin-like GTPase superfamily, dynamin Fzo YdjA family protein [Lyophyllum shimeji]|uniref:TRAFAC class dynamin-like GTPase superfamily, dynamin Fzo YdjA family protein n=1 Tax=Lyophyllum shimeji TaxID=47721 RepID=A0A9P3PMI3_LYOSH|nr:putative TRAFAC class dynamin-like GTPase superfamily, dynamin Fzo YdjA family protein [Lyophyllum shimeji]
MAQSYFPSRVASPVSAFTDSANPLNGEKHLKVEDVQEAYMAQKERLVGAIDSTKRILSEIRTFNKDEWVVRYPRLRDQPAEETQETSSTSSRRRKGIRKSLSFADDPTTETEVVLSEPGKGMTRSVTLASIADIQGEEEDATAPADKENESQRLLPASDFHVLRLDLKLGASGASNSAASLVSQLEKSSIANLIDERIGASLNHVDKLRLRVEDTSSKVLVTGDLNAGKSTFVNALLRREVMPVDQQPCTTAFCEVHDAAENQGKEEVHVLKEGVAYDINDDSTFVRGSIADLEGIVADNEDTQQMIKLYLADTRAPSESLLNNGVVDISLIDAPGLNRDSLKTTAVFARQEEIDVVVFVVSAENHFTLSAKEFLWNASNEKAYLFIVVNKFDQIKNKEKCRRLVLEQIRQLSPRTYEDAQDLVHFVDSATALQPYTANPAFDDLESALRSFVLVKRSKSKLHPVSTYLSNLLSDIELLAGANAIVADAELQEARDNLNQARPVLEKMKSGRDALENGLEATEEEGADKAASKTRTILTNALDLVGQGKLGVEKPLVPMPTYPGVLGIWDYARDVRRALLASLDAAVKQAEDEARVITSAGVETIKALGEVHLPEGVERSRRVFMPEAMFSAMRRGTKGHKSRRSASHGGAVVAGGLHGLGIGLAQRSDMLETTFLDLFDVHHQLWLHFGDGSKDDVDDEKLSVVPSALSLLSIGVGTLTMVGGQAVGARGLIEGILRITDLVGNESTRKWAAPVLGAFTIGLTAYLILELPSSIPRTVGRRVRASVVRKDGEGETFVDVHVGRVSKETRKVLRLASWDLRERFRGAMEERSREVKGAEEMERKALRAKEWFGDVGRRTGEIRVEANLANEA